MSEQQSEKAEKLEKEEEKEHEKKEKEEKDWEEKWRRDPLGSIVWAAILIWAGAVLLVSNLVRFGDFRRWFGPGQENVWAIIVMGAGVIVLLGVGARLLLPSYRRPVSGDIVFAVILIAVGVGLLWNWTVAGAAALIAIGLSILLRGLFRQR